jgi:polysaccharide biosynthesis transport protein
VLQTMAARREPGTTGEPKFAASRERISSTELRADENAYVSPERVWNFLRRQKWTLAIAVAVALLLGAAFIAFSPPKYRSLARFLIDPRGLSILKNEITRTSDSADANLLDVENQRYVILSRSVLVATVKRAHLEESPLFGNAPPGFFGRLSAVFGRPTAVQDREDRAIAALADAVDVVRGERAYILDIVVTTRDAQLSADLANMIAKIYQEQAQDARTQTAKRASEALNGRAAELAHEVQQAEEEVQTFRLRNNIAFTATGQLLGDQQVSDLSTQLAMAKARTAAAQARVDQLEQATKSKLDSSQLPEAMQSPVITGLRAQYGQLVQQEASYLTQYGPKHPALVQVREQIQDVRNLIAAEIARIAQSARTDLSRAKTAEGTLARSMGTVRQDIGDNAGALARLHELERSADAKKSIYQSVLTRQKELEEQQGIDTSNTRIISDAVPATKPSGPPAPLVLAGALILGLAAGGGIGVLREAIGRGSSAVEDLESVLGVPFLGRFTGHAEKSGDIGGDGEAGSQAGAVENLLRFCDDEEGPCILGIVALHQDALRPRLLAALSAAAADENLAIGFIECDSNPASVAKRGEGFFARTPAETPAEPDDEAAEIVPLADLLLHARGPLTLRHLRGKLRDYATRRDLVFVNMPAVIDVGMPPVLLEAVDAIVLAIADRDGDDEKIAKLMEFVGKARTPVVGFIATGKRRAS